MFAVLRGASIGAPSASIAVIALFLLLGTACAGRQRVDRALGPSPAGPDSSSSSSSSTSAATAAPTTATASGKVIDLWPEGVPGILANAPPERIEDGRVYNVSTPTLTLFEPPAGTSNGTAVIVCPGGGYVRLAVAKEGSSMTRWLTSLGVTVLVLKYRVSPYQHPAPLRDVLRAVRWVRSRAADLGIKPDRIGVFGSSAGGHLAASAATLFDAPEGKTGAALDAVSARPDFIALTYPVITMRDPYAHAGSRQALIGDHPTAELANQLSVELHVTKSTPPVFLVHTQEDRSVPLENSILFYQALRAAGVDAELHLYEKGPHGFGLQTGLGPTSEWPKRCEEWMRSHGFLPATPNGTASLDAGPRLPN